MKSSEELKWHLPIKTKDGSPARLLGVLFGADHPYVVALTDEDGEETAETYSEKGQYYYGESSSTKDLVNTGNEDPEGLTEQQKEYIRTALSL